MTTEEQLITCAYYAMDKTATDKEAAWNDALQWLAKTLQSGKFKGMGLDAIGGLGGAGVGGALGSVLFPQNRMLGALGGTLLGAGAGYFGGKYAPQAGNWLQSLTKQPEAAAPAATPMATPAAKPVQAPLSKAPQVQGTPLGDYQTDNSPYAATA